MAEDAPNAVDDTIEGTDKTVSEDTPSKTKNVPNEERDSNTEFDPTDIEAQNQGHSQSGTAVRRSTRRKPGPPARYKDFASFAFLTELTTLGDREVPRSIEEAITGPNRNQWIQAIEIEMNSLENLGVFEAQTPPPGRKLIGCKWVFNVKRDSAGHIVRHKARLVAKGFSQINGIDYKEVYSPVVKYKTFRMLLGLCAEKGYEMEQVDIKTAFIRSDLEEEIYMQPPPLPEQLKDRFPASSWTNKA